MPQYRGTLFFEGDVNGWTENYYLISSALSGAIEDLVNITNARLELLHETLDIATGSISDIAIRGDSFQVFAGPQSGTAVDPLLWLNLDLAILMKWQTELLSRNKTFLRGIPAGQTSADFYIPTPAFNPKIDAYIAAVSTNALMKVLNPVHSVPPLPSDYQFKPVLGGVVNARIARRKTGRPSNLPRGRRLAS
jgi:hypothetical protein